MNMLKTHKPNIKYLALDKVDSAKFISLLNKKKIREHLIGHQLFDSNTLRAWITSKIEMDSSDGCKIRAILVDKELVGWCGIQCEDEKYEIAAVIDDNYWGLGTKVFQEMIKWAKALGHQTVFIHFLHTRPEYKFLRKMAKNVYKSELLGAHFTTYELEVNNIAKHS